VSILHEPRGILAGTCNFPWHGGSILTERHTPPFFKETLMSGITEITRENFESEVLQATLPVLVDLYAPWCGPCQMMATVLQQVAGQLAGRAKVVKINTDDLPDLASAFGVQSIPTLALVHQKRVIDMKVGMTPARELVQMIDQVAAAA
jgi:thioredoxin 1